MKRTFVKALLAIGISAACACGMAACSGSSSGGVAATVNGQEIAEDDVTSMIEGIRSQAGLTDEDTWGQWLADNSLTPESVREEMIDSYADEILIADAAEERGVSVDDDTVQSYIDSMKSNYDSDEAWESALEAAGFTEDQYRNTIKTSLLSQEILKTFSSEDADEDTLLSYAKMYASYYNGAKRSSHILFSADDEATAQQVLDQINNGEISFEDAAEQYSTDTASAENGGDVGWDKLNSFVDEYQTALDGLEKDQVSGLVTSTYGIHIIKCTDVFEAPDEVTSIDQLPEAFQDSIRSMVESSTQQSAFNEWYQDFKENADIVINDMPEGLPYDVDMSKYDTSTDDADSTESDDPADSTDSSAASSESEADDSTAQEADGSDAASDESSAEQ